MSMSVVALAATVMPNLTAWCFLVRRRVQTALGRAPHIPVAQHTAWQPAERAETLAHMREAPGSGPVIVEVLHGNELPFRFAGRALRFSLLREHLVFTGRRIPSYVERVVNGGMYIDDRGLFFSNKRVGGLAVKVIVAWPPAKRLDGALLFVAAGNKDGSPPTGCLPTGALVDFRWVKTRVTGAILPSGETLDGGEVEKILKMSEGAQ